MSFIRARQRAITALFPQPGNKRFLVPKRGGSSVPPSYNVVDVAEGFLMTISPSGTGNSEFTWCGWVRPAVIPAISVLWQRHFGSDSLRNWGGMQALSGGNPNTPYGKISNSGGSTIISTASLTPMIVGNAYHIGIALNEVTGDYQCFLNGVDVTDGSYTPDTAGSNSDMNLFSSPSGANFYTGLSTEFWWDDTYIDLSANIQKWYNNGTFIDLGPRGEIPTGSIPRVYMGGDMTADTGGAVGGVPGTGYNGWCNNGTISFTGSGSVVDA
jgi:hypothetical protein